MTKERISLRNRWRRWRGKDYLTYRVIRKGKP